MYIKTCAISGLSSTTTQNPEPTIIYSTFQLIGREQWSIICKRTISFLQCAHLLKVSCRSYQLSDRRLVIWTIYMRLGIYKFGSMFSRSTFSVINQMLRLYSKHTFLLKVATCTLHGYVLSVKHNGSEIVNSRPVSWAYSSWQLFFL